MVMGIDTMKSLRNCIGMVGLHCFSNYGMLLKVIHLGAIYRSLGTHANRVS